MAGLGNGNCPFCPPPLDPPMAYAENGSMIASQPWLPPCFLGAVHKLRYQFFATFRPPLLRCFAWFPYTFNISVHAPSTPPLPPRSVT